MVPQQKAKLMVVIHVESMTEWLKVSNSNELINDPSQELIPPLQCWADGSPANEINWPQKLAQKIKVLAHVCQLYLVFWLKKKIALIQVSHYIQIQQGLTVAWYLLTHSLSKNELTSIIAPT